MRSILVSNSFPFSLIRRRVVVETREVGDLLTVMHDRPWISAWGHANTVQAASRLACADLRPRTERPALVLGEEGLPTFEGQVFEECWLLSPDYVPGFRPAVGEEVASDKIQGWQVLRLSWEDSPDTPSDGTRPVEDRLDQIAEALERIESRLDSTHHGSAPDAGMRTGGPALSSSADGSAPPSDEESSITPLLAARNLTIQPGPERDLADQTLDRLAMQVGRNYGALSGVLASIKRTMQKGGGFQLHLASASQQDLATITANCKEWHKLALLHSCHYQRSPERLLHIKTSSLPRAINFFSGQWLERFLEGTIRECCRRVGHELRRPLSLELLCNPKISLPNGDQFELDALAAVNGTRLYWFEAKSGGYQSHALRYSKMAKRLGTAPENSFMVLADTDSETCLTLGSLFSMTVCNLVTFADAFETALRRDLGAEVEVKRSETTSVPA